MVLLEADDDHFAWMLGECAHVKDLRLPPRGVDTRPVLEKLRRLSADMRAQNRTAVWMMVVESEVVGLCGNNRPPNPDGVVEIGYGVAESRRRHGYATEAVAALLGILFQDSDIKAVVADNRG
jgi:RimJ/RimL family protein N-acetyltransferase